MSESTIRLNDVEKKDKRLLAALLLIPAIFLFLGDLDNDAWFLLNHGRYVFEHGIPHIDPFTIHEGFEFVMHQWLSASIFWVVYNAIGAIGLKILVFISYVITIFILHKLYMRVSNNYFFISYILLWPAIFVLMFFMTERPYIFSTPIICIEMYALESYLYTRNKRFLYILPIISFLLINLQAAMWPVLFVLLLPYIVDSVEISYKNINKKGYEKQPILISASLMVIAAFMNPYGIKLLSYGFRSVGHEEINLIVGEMKPPDISNKIGMSVFGLILLVILVYAIYRNGRTNLRYFLLTLGTCYMTLLYYRNFILFSICGIFPLAYYLKEIRFTFLYQENNEKSLKIRKVLITAIILVVCISLLRYELSKTKYSSEYELLYDTVTYLIKNEDVEDIILYTGYNDGNLPEFLGIPSYLDTRAEVFIKKNNKKYDVLREYALMQFGIIHYSEVLDRYGFTHLIINNDDILNTYLEHDNNYILSYKNEEYKLFQRK